MMNYLFHPEDKEAAFLFNRVHDKVTQVQSLLIFFLDAAPMKYSAEHFSVEAIHGMAFLISEMVEALGEARELLQELARHGQTLEAPEDQHGPTSFSMEA